MKPSAELSIDCYVDSDFAGLWSYEDDQDPTCVRSRNGFLIMIGNCPAIWPSKLQTEITLSTMDAEYIILSTVLKYLIPFQRLVKAVWNAVGLDDNTASTIRTTVWEYNQGCAILANLEPPRMTPRSKHYALKYHWFRTQLKPKSISIKPITTTEQLADIFTKGLRCILFEQCRFKSMGLVIC